MLAVRAGAGHPVVRMSLPGWRIFTIATLSAAVALGVALGTRAPEVTGESPPRSRAAHHDEDIP